MTEIGRLELRYRRLLRFDRALWIVYAATAIIPAYFLISSSYARAFHVFGVIAILAVAWFGWTVDSRILDGRTKKEATAYGVTVSFILSRVAILGAGAVLVGSEVAGLFGVPMSANIYWGALLEILIAPPVTYLLFFASIYRLIYHVAVHFLLKIEDIKKTANQALQTTPVTRRET
jgi:hypothetical protein